MNYDASPLFADSFSLFNEELGLCTANGFL